MQVWQQSGEINKAFQQLQSIGKYLFKILEINIVLQHNIYGKY